MADSAFPSPSFANTVTPPHSQNSYSQSLYALQPDSNAKTLVRRLVWKMAIATFILMAIGSATRVMNAGLACPDWPLCYGTLYPAQQMNLQVFLEWFHRLDAALIGVMAIALMALSWINRRVLPGWMPAASVGAFGLICFQGILGGLTVTEMLRFDIVTAHLGTALIFFMTLLVIGIFLLPPQESSKASRQDRQATTFRGIHWVSLVAAVLIYAQSRTGALVGSQWALHQCLSLASLCRVMNTHLIGVIPASLATLAVVAIAWRTPSLNPTLRTLSWGVGALLGTQILLGVSTFKLHLQVEVLTVLHQSVGAALLATLLIIAVLGFRFRHLAIANA
ncbi:MAG: heme A synthase [Leptolyngbyaceae bacterium]|nr:heme A synthase [Leptolyngbyaceae bacterium]